MNAVCCECVFTHRSYYFSAIQKTLYYECIYLTVIWYSNTGNFRMIGDDLVNSYHLLLCCLDLVYANALLCANKKDLINPYFKGDPHEHTVISPLRNMDASF